MGSGDGGDGGGGGTDTATPTPTDTPTPQTEGQFSLVEPDMESKATGTVWHARNKAAEQKFNTTKDVFNSDYTPSIKLSKIADLRKKTTSAIPAGRGPHIFEWAHDWGGEYWDRGFLSDQSGNLRVPKDMFTGAAQTAMQYKGNVIGIPRSAECPALLYNKDMIDQPPETLSEFKEMMEQHYDPDNGTYGLGYPVNTYFISAWAQAFGGFIYDGEKDKLGHTMSETLKGFRIVKEDLWPFMPKDPAYGAQAAAFSSGNAPFAINGPWSLSTLNDKGINYGVSTLPKPKNGTPRPYTGVKMFYFTKRMDQEPTKGKAARQFAEWYASNEGKLLGLAKTQGFIPVHKDVVAKDDLPSEVSAYAAQVEDGYPMPSTVHMNAVWAPTKNAFLKYLKGNAKLKPAMENAEKQIKSNWE